MAKARITSCPDPDIQAEPRAAFELSPLILCVTGLTAGARALEAGFALHLTKPVDAGRLRRVLS